MRTFEEIKADVDYAMKFNDADSLIRYADELGALGTPIAEAAASAARGVASYLRGNYPLALEHYQHALAMHNDLGNRSGVARVTGNIGNVHNSTGNHTIALEYYQRALVMHGELGDRSGAARITGNIGNLHNKAGNHALALEHHHRALDMHEDLGERILVASVIGNIGNVHNRTGNYPLAFDHFNRALAIHEELGDHSGVARMNGNIGNVRNATGNYQLALEHYHRALAIYEELGNRSGVALHTGNIGSVHSSTGNYSLALDHFLLALAFYKEMHDYGGEAYITCSITRSHIRVEEFAEAELYLSTLDEMHIDDPRVLINRELERSSIQLHYGKTQEALQTLAKALEITQTHSLRAEQATVHEVLRDLAQQRHDFAAYIEHNNEFTRITEEIDGKETATKLAMQDKQREIDAERREHEKQIAVLHSTLPKHIADRVARGEVVTDSYEDAAVLFLDVVGFTNNSAQLDAGEVVELLQKIFTTFDSICATHNVTKIKTIGDSYMAVAFPETGASHTANIAHAAQSMMNAQFTWSHIGTQVQFRIGLHCGPVVAGVLGTQRMQYDVWGDTVNVASRMESTSEPGKIHISESFAKSLHNVSPERSPEGSPLAIERGEIEVKGKGKMKTYWLESVSA